MTGGEGSAPPAGARALVTLADWPLGLELLALSRGGEAFGGASETGGATELCALALSGDDAPIKIRLRARSKLRLVCIFQIALVQRLTGRAHRAAPGRISAVTWSSNLTEMGAS